MQPESPLETGEVVGPTAKGPSDPPPGGDSPPPGRIVGLALWFYGGMLVVAALWRIGLQRAPLGRAGPEAGVDWLRDALLGALAAALVIALSALYTRHSRSGAQLARALARTIGPLRPGQAWLLALVSGIAEEAFFRGALQPVVGLWLASLLFAAAHFVPRREMLPWSAFSLGAGLLLGGLYAVTGNLLAPIVAHVGVNGVNLNRLVREWGGPEPPR